MGCGSQQTVESSGFVASDLEQNTQINVEGVEKQSFNNIAESQVEITPKQQKLLNIARKLKSQINFTEFYQLRSQMISFSNVCPVVPQRMLNFEEEIKAQNLKLSKQAADGQPKFIFSTTSVADAPDYNKVDKTDTQSATQVQRTQQHLEEVKKCTIDKKQLRLF